MVGVIAPEAHAAVQATRNRRIGLLATQATVSSGRYEELVRALDAGVEVLSVACPRLVPLIEGDDPFAEETAAAVREYAAPLKDAGVDTVILGCTHYPLIRPILQRVFGRDVTLVFSAEETAREVAETLARKRIENDPAREGAYRFLTTGDVDGFRDDGPPLPPASDRGRRARGDRDARGGGRMTRERRRAGTTSSARSSCIPDWLENAHGSVLYSQGKTRVLCTAMVEEGVPRWLHRSGRGWMTAEYSLLPASTGERVAREAAQGQAGRAHRRDPAADRPGAPLGLRLQRARRADALARLRRAPGGRRHPLRCDLGRLRRRPSRARPLRALEGARGPDRGRLGRRRRRRAGCSISTTPRTPPPRPT